MNSFSVLPVKLDIYAIFIFLGVVQGLFLSFFFLRKSASAANRMLGVLVLGMTAINTEIFLCYSRYIVRLIHLVDFSEPCNFLLGPAFFLYIRYRIFPENKTTRKPLLHFIPFAVYACYSICFFRQIAEYKYNAFLSAYFPGEPHITVMEIGRSDPLLLKEWINEITLVHFLIYLGAALLIVGKGFKKAGLPFLSTADKPLLRARNLSLFSLLYLLFLFWIKTSFREDLGDHVLAAAISVFIYSISFWVMKQSLFFSEDSWSQTRKYEKSSLSEEMMEQVIKRLPVMMEAEKPFLESSFSLPTLAKKTGVSTHHLSQILNDRLKKSFFEFTATYRIEEAKKIILAPHYDHFKMEKIAEAVGYNSKSAFNKAFKQQVGVTPSQFKERNRKG